MFSYASDVAQVGEALPYCFTAVPIQVAIAYLECPLCVCSAPVDTLVVPRK